MTSESILVLVILGTAIFLFTLDKIRPDIISMMVLLTVVITGLLPSAEAFAGFANPAVITVWAVFIIGGALNRTGVGDLIAQQFLRFAGENFFRILALLMVFTGFMSAFMNNIGAVAIVMPAAFAICRQKNIPPSKLLMPLAFASLLGGNITLIGTPPNILATNLLAQSDAGITFGFFDFAPSGLISLAAGLVYMLTIGHKLLPDRLSAADAVANTYPTRDYLSEVRIHANSKIINQSVEGTKFGEKYGLHILQIRRQDETFLPVPEFRLHRGDILLVQGPYRDILTACKELRLEARQGWSEEAWQLYDPDMELRLAEIALTPRSRREGQTVTEMEFRSRYGLSVLAIQHHGRAITDHLGEVPLSLGDAILVQGPLEKLRLLYENPNFLVLDLPTLEVKRTKKAPLAVGIFATALFVVTMGWLDVSTTLVAAAFAMVITQIISMEEAYNSIDWQSIFLIVGMLPLGIAMEKTQTAQLIAQQVVNLTGPWGATAVLAGIYFLSMVMTASLSNAAAVVIMVPIALNTAHQLGVNPQAFVMATVVATSSDFLTPVGHQVNVVVFGPGGYKFMDYPRVGIGLAIFLWILMVIFLPIIWPF
jgi:di/tricarboxylate transporter